MYLRRPCYTATALVPMTEAAAKTLPATTLARLTVWNQTYEGVCFPKSGSDISDPVSPVGCTFEGLHKTSFMTFTVHGFLTPTKKITYGDGQVLSGKCLAVTLQKDLTLALAFPKTAGHCGVPLLNHHYKDVAPNEVRNMAVGATRESQRRAPYDLQKTPDRLEDLKISRPHLFNLIAYIGDATGVPPEILFSIIDRETHFNRRAAHPVYKGIGQSDVGTWRGVTDSPLFKKVYEHAYPDREIPMRGEDAFADVLAIAVKALNGASRYGIRPALTEEFFVTVEACHREGLNGARRVVKMVKEKRFDELSRRYKSRFDFVKDLHRIYEIIRIRSGKERIAEAT